MNPLIILQKRVVFERKTFFLVTMHSCFLIMVFSKALLLLLLILIGIFKKSLSIKLWHLNHTVLFLLQT